ncbi:MAG: DUF3916 domain-containing protein [Spirochaetaceae bacterium]|nr:DUF3916 domain-containing protein [Spirochaetaceae bacterium]
MDLVRTLDTTGSPRKKPRGARRKLEDMRRELREATEAFPAPMEEFWHLHLPVPQALVDSRRTPFGVRRECALALLEGARRLAETRPAELPGARIVVLIALPSLWWESQLLIFFNERYFANFFYRDNEYQRWEELAPKSGIVSSWSLGEIEGFSERSYRETTWDDGVPSFSELHYIGELGESSV